MRSSNLVPSSEDDRTNSRSSHGMLDEQFLRLVRLSKEITAEGLLETPEDAKGGPNGIHTVSNETRYCL